MRKEETPENQDEREDEARDERTETWKDSSEYALPGKNNYKSNMRIVENV